MAQNWPKLKKIEKNLKFPKFSDIDFYMSKYHFFQYFSDFCPKNWPKIDHFLLNFEFHPSLLIRFSDPEIPIVRGQLQEIAAAASTVTNVANNSNNDK